MANSVVIGVPPCVLNSLFIAKWKRTLLQFQLEFPTQIISDFRLRPLLRCATCLQMFQLQLQPELSLGSPSALALPAAEQADIQTASQAFHTFALIFNFIFSQANHGKETYTYYG